MWDLESVNHMRDVLKTKYTLADARKHFERIMTDSNALLELSIEDDRQGREHLLVCLRLSLINIST